LKGCFFRELYIAIRVKVLLSEITKKIKECVSEIEYYNSDAPDITIPAVNSLKECEKLINNLNEENIEKALKVVTRLYQQARAYFEFVPTSVSNLMYIKDWLEKAKK